MMLRINSQKSGLSDKWAHSKENGVVNLVAFLLLEGHYSGPDTVIALPEKAQHRLGLL